MAGGILVGKRLTLALELTPINPVGRPVKVPRAGLQLPMLEGISADDERQAVYYYFNSKL